MSTYWTQEFYFPLHNYPLCRIHSHKSLYTVRAFSRILRRVQFSYTFVPAFEALRLYHSFSPLKSFWRQNMQVSGISDTSIHQHPYKPARMITKPGWATKHDGSPRARSLLPYILEPARHPDRVIRDSSDAVLIHDKYPKAQVHLLVLPKWQPHRDLHPHDAFEDPNFLAMIRKQVAEGLTIAVPMLKAKMYDTLRADGLEVKQIESLMNMRDFIQDFQVGIHAHPSQHELHVHIISRDMISWHPYGSRHYHAFNTPFFVPLELYPLPEDDIRREVPYQNANLTKEDFDCWRCGKNFGTHWPAMLKHLEGEWKGWIREGRNHCYKVAHDEQ